MRLHLGGHLGWYDPQKRSDVEIHLSAPVELKTLVQALGLPAGEISIIAVNGTHTPLDGTWVHDNDQVELFPPIGGGACAITGLILDDAPAALMAES